MSEGIHVCFNDAGHILGSAETELWVQEGDSETKIVFSGDLGVDHRPILRDPTIIRHADYVIMESTYGNRLHPENAMSIEKLVKVILRTVERGGTVVIPSFAVGRTQEMIYQLNMLYDENPETYGKLKNVPVYIDSPMANAATEVFKKNTAVFDDDFKAFMDKGDHPLEFKNLHFTRSTEESQALNSDRKPKIIISASGMCEAGRIRHHLKHNLWNPKCSIVFVGYQAEGTLGRKLVEGAESVNLFGEEIQVNAEIVNLEGFSGHADRDGLAHWVGSFVTHPMVFLVHGEKEAKEDFAAYLGENLDIHPIVIQQNSEFELVPGSRPEGTHVGPVSAFQLDADEINALRNKISGLSSSIGDLLNTAAVETGKNISPERLIEINNIIQELAESEANLKAALLEEAEEERTSEE